jgi:hypothetical protein
VATLLGQWGVNINRLETTLKDEHGSVVDFLLEFTDDRRMQSALEELAALDGVTVDRISRYPWGGGLRYDLEVMHRMFCSELPPEQVFATSAPLLCDGRWSLLVNIRTFRVVLRTALAPEVAPADLTALAPLDRTHTGRLSAAPGLHDSGIPVAVIALTADQALLIGRPDGPEFAASELARLDHLAAAASGSCPSTLGGAGA